MTKMDLCNIIIALALTLHSCGGQGSQTASVEYYITAPQLSSHSCGGQDSNKTLSIVTSVVLTLYVLYFAVLLYMLLFLM